ncbi:hypothetical protein CC2G_004816, partial [Coprinopsis cinerea AmutBmut pab1-1]
GGVPEAPAVQASQPQDSECGVPGTPATSALTTFCLTPPPGSPRSRGPGPSRRSLNDHSQNVVFLEHPPRTEVSTNHHTGIAVFQEHRVRRSLPPASECGAPGTPPTVVSATGLRGRRSRNTAYRDTNHRSQNAVFQERRIQRPLTLRAGTRQKPQNQWFSSLTATDQPIT